MSKIDFKKIYKELFSPSKKEFSIVDVPAFQFLMIDGQGDPNTSKEYKLAIEALYAIAYGIKMGLKKGDQPKGYDDYTVPPLEGLWYIDDMSKFKDTAKSKWKWTMMIMQPDFVSQKHLATYKEIVRKKKSIASIDMVRLEKYSEGKSVQILYLGAYKDEGPTIAKMHDFIKEKGYKRSGHHHEIYLSDPRRVKPERLKTIIRQPIKS